MLLRVRPTQRSKYSRGRLLTLAGRYLLTGGRLRRPLARVTLIALIGYASFAQADSAMPQAGENFVNARTRLYAAGWRADPLSHASSGEYMGLDRLLIQSGYLEVDYCSVGKSFCTLQYLKGQACLRVHTQGEQIQAMKVERWSNDCREREAAERPDLPPADVRYLVQWKSDCENFGQFTGSTPICARSRKNMRETPK